MMHIEALSLKRIASGGTKVSVKIACDAEENIVLEKALMWPWWKEDCSQKKRTTD